MYHIGLLMDLGSSYGRRVFAGCRRVFYVADDVVISVAVANGIGLEQLLQAGVDALVVHANDQELVDRLAVSGKPVINTSFCIANALPRVGLDDEGIGRLAADYFIERHFRHVGFVGFTDRLYSIRRRQGLINRLAETDISQTTLVWQEDMPAEEVAQWLQSLPGPAGVFVLGDEMALRVVRVAKRYGIDIPERVAVLSGTNDEEVCSLAHPGLSAIDVPIEEVGVRAAEQLLACIRHGEELPETVLLPPGPVKERRSTDIEAIGDAEIARALHFIRQHAHEHISVGDVVAHVGAGRRNLERKFAMVLERSIYRHITYVRLGLVKNMLHETDLSLGEIAGKTGFAGAQHLCDVFRRHERMTPGAYRRRPTTAVTFVPAAV